MSARANWHLDVEIDTSDPFGQADPDAGEPVVLTDTDALVRRVVELLYREGELERDGMTCALKGRPGACCSACPLRGSRKAHRIRELCKLGTEQERALMSTFAADA